MVMGIRLVIDGQDVRQSWDGSSLTALSGLSITWGRDDPYEATAPGTLSASLIDPTGEWVSSSSLAGRPVLVYQTGGSFGERVVFRGRITSGKPVRRSVYNPRSRTREPVWVVEFAAGDEMATAAGTVVPGEMGANSVEGLGGWGEQDGETRMTNLYNRGASRIFPGGPAWPSSKPTSGVALRLHGQAAADRRTVLELIEQVFRTLPMGVVNYDPAASRVSYGSFAVAVAAALKFDGSLVTLSLPGALVVDADLVGVPDGLHAETTANDAIDIVQVSYFWYGQDPNTTGARRVTYTNPLIQRTTARGAASGGSRILDYQTQLMTFDPKEFEAGGVDAYNAGPGWLAGELVKIVDSLNGQLKLPTLRFDDRRLPQPDDVTSTVYYPRQPTTSPPFYFAGSVFNALPNAGPQYQIVGGKLAYDGGWTHDVNVIPARNAAAADLPLSTLFGSSDAQIGQFDSPIRLADLATVSKGL